MVTHSDGRPRGRQGQAEWQKADELACRMASPRRVPAVRSRSQEGRSRKDLRDAPSPRIAVAACEMPLDPDIM